MSFKLLMRNVHFLQVSCGSYSCYTSFYNAKGTLGHNVIATDICENVFSIFSFSHRCALLKLSPNFLPFTQAISSILLAALSVAVG